TVPKAAQVNHGGAATELVEQSSEGFAFTGLDVAVITVTADLVVTAQYSINQYTVTFVDWNATVLKTEQVNHGAAATAPADPVRKIGSASGREGALNTVFAVSVGTRPRTHDHHTLTQAART